MLRFTTIAFLAFLFTTEVRADDVDYLRDVKPLLQEKCFSCHGALKQQGGLRVDTVASLLKGGDGGAALVGGKPAESLLIDATGDAVGSGMPLRKTKVR